MMINEWDVRNAHRRHSLFFTDHAIIRMTQRRISTASVIECIENGELIEIQPGCARHRDERAIFFDRNEMLGVAVAQGEYSCAVVTVYQVDFRIWMFSGDTLVRRAQRSALETG